MLCFKILVLNSDLIRTKITTCMQQHDIAKLFDPNVIVARSALTAFPMEKIDKI